jgi:hypothetical protein
MDGRRTARAPAFAARQVLRAAAKAAHQLHGAAQIGERLQLEDLVALDGGNAFVGVFVEQGFEHLAGYGAVVGEDVALLHAAGAFAAGERGLVVGHMQQQVERVEVHHAHMCDFIGQGFEQHALPFQLLQQGGLAVGLLPCLQKLVERVVFFQQVDAGVVAQAFGDELAIGVEVLHALAGHGHGDVVAEDVFFGAIGGATAAREGAERVQGVQRV